ncbi:MAG TPA: hypothetical protein VIP11_17710 [Gemmatimonadaceae bacterium]
MQLGAGTLFLAQRNDRIDTSAATMATSEPIATGVKESRSPMLTTRPRSAPSAMRTPISRVRRATTYASTP